ncbi:2-nitropropane dioxygenase [Trametes versicolor FP-101664 SS1]|uniref:2-nitropropane dioxygenase n=1 Tax=Trametes versicolor (strain FP-101664) TaxID=717944 RepID=UPI00046240A6|nr:2-nitropropane dioxygenase [Trametes versicolor FP-101664 SS1]EIW58710.1 2-nitropropane dioxygenase [Trametes versicolor FP-101664 SS1]
MPAVNTRLTSLLGIRAPVVSAAMAYGSSPKLALEVSRGGGFGFYGVGAATPNKLREDLLQARASVSDLGNKPLPIGCGFIGWILDSQEEEYKKLVDTAIESGVRAIWVSFGNDLPRWINYIRGSPAYAVHKPLIFAQVTSLEEAIKAVNDWKVDVLVVQGNESGGHGGAAAPSTMVLLSEVLAALPKESAPPVLAAGGIANGTQAAAYLTAGASGAVLGTRFLLTPESPYSDAQKSVLLGANSLQTVRSLAFDDARGTNSWPAGVDGRGIRNKIVGDAEAGADAQTLQERFRAAAQAGDPEYLLVWSGQGVSLVNDIKPAKDIVEELHADIVQALQRAQRLLG